MSNRAGSEKLANGDISNSSASSDNAVSEAFSNGVSQGQTNADRNNGKGLVVNVVTGQGGAGHYATYYAIKALAEQQGLPWTFQVTDMDEIIENLSAQNQVKNAYEMFGFSGHDLYNLMVKGGWTWLWPLKMRLNKLLVKMNHDIGVKIFTEYWQQQRPDLVVSVMPLYNKGLWQSLQQAQPGTPYITVMTDFADSPPAFWMDEDIENRLLCGTQQAVQQARELGISEARITQNSGLVVHPDFHEVSHPTAEQKKQQKEALGLSPEVPTVLVMFGGNGSPSMQTIADRLERLGDRIQVIFICGRNQDLLDSLSQNTLSQNSSGQKRCVLGFVDSVADYLAASDIFIGKPGNVSISEALTVGVPIITERNRSTMMQEKDCANWVEQKGCGVVLPNFKSVDRAVEQMLMPAAYAQYQQALQAHRNRAVFETLEVMKQALESVATPLATPLATEQKAKQIAEQTTEKAVAQKAVVETA